MKLFDAPAFDADDLAYPADEARLVNDDFPRQEFAAR